ncbi:MAG: ABC transporter ATP-binding protein [Atopobiaceae bacterium]|nr:ABC transporter ATP-binding protein [Atopobiaceae bacterium]
MTNVRELTSQAPTNLPERSSSSPHILASPEEVAANEIVLEVKDLCIEFHDHKLPERVVENFNLVLHKGEIMGIVGESGSGKSMSALAIAGLLNRKTISKSGQILFEDKDFLNCDRRCLRKYQGDEISIIFQEPMTSLNPLHRIGRQVEESLRIHHPRLSKARRYELAIYTMRAVGLPEPEKVYRMYPHELSGGMRQRAMIAAAMIGDPKILIADEPTTALDVTIQAQIIDLLKEINVSQGTAILFISHDLSLVEQLCHRVIVMQQGKIIETGITHDVFTNPQEAYTKALIDAIPKVEL